MVPRMTQSETWAIRVRGVGKTFDARRPVLRNIQFDVRAGERVALLGASGSGKSTLLRCLCALESIDPGNASVEVFGRELQSHGRIAAGARAIRRDVGIVFQQFNLVGRLPVLTNVLTGLAAELPLWRSMTGRFTAAERRRALQALDAMGLAAQATQRASTLSGGQQQRAAIARVLVQGARLLLADEPVASLDPESTRRVMELMADLNRSQGLTLLVSLHQVSLARRYCDRVIALRDGLLVFDGPTDALTPDFLRLLYGTSAEELLVGEGPAGGGAPGADLPEAGPNLALAA
jgi:phosphonate transport system ATP-binding protein